MIAADTVFSSILIDDTTLEFTIKNFIWSFIPSVERLT